MNNSEEVISGKPKQEVIEPSNTKSKIDAAVLWLSTVYQVDDPDIIVGAYGCCFTPDAGEAGSKKRTLILGEEYPVGSGFWYMRVTVPLKSVFNFRLVLVDRDSRIMFMTEDLDVDRTVHATADMGYFLPWGCSYHTAEPSPLHLEAVLPKLTSSQLKVITMDDEPEDENNKQSLATSTSTPLLSLPRDNNPLPKSLSLKYHESESWLIQMYQ